MATRVQKVLAHLGVGSRRHCEGLIRAGRVTLDGEPVEIGQSVNQDQHHLLAVDGKPVGQSPDKIYLLLNKPAGYVTTVSDPQGRPTVMELLPPDSLQGEGRVYPVGRLDRDTEGVLIFTNDGEMVHRLLHPSSGVEKQYRARVDRAVNSGHLERLRVGPVLDDGPSLPPLEVKGQEFEVMMTLKEGRKRQVKRMLGAVGLKCCYLERLRFGNLTVGKLKRGQHRALTAAEVESLLQLIGDVS